MHGCNVPESHEVPGSLKVEGRGPATTPESQPRPCSGVKCGRPSSLCMPSPRKPRRYLWPLLKHSYKKVRYKILVRPSGLARLRTVDMNGREVARDSQVNVAKETGDTPKRQGREGVLSEARPGYCHSNSWNSLPRLDCRCFLTLLFTLLVEISKPESEAVNPVPQESPSYLVELSFVFPATPNGCCEWTCKCRKESMGE